MHNEAHYDMSLHVYSVSGSYAPPITFFVPSLLIPILFADSAPSALMFVLFLSLSLFIWFTLIWWPDGVH